MQPPSGSSDFRNGQLQQQQQQPYPYGYDSYPPPGGSSSYDYGFQRGPMQSGMEGMPSPYGSGNGNASGSWESPYNGASSSSQDRNREQPPWMMGEGNGIYGQMGMHGDMSRNSSGAIEGNVNAHGLGHGGAGLGLGGDEDSWRRNGSSWGGEYGKPPGLDSGMEKELETVSFTFRFHQV
jgi:hypothetical protein